MASSEASERQFVTKSRNQSDALIRNLQDLFARRADFFHVDMAFLYGSRAEGIPRKDSDIDLGVFFEDEIISDEEVFDLTTRISVYLSKEMKCNANVVPIYSDFRKPMLYYNVIIKGVPLYIKDDSKYLDLRNEALYQMEDFEIFGRGWQILVSRKNLEGLLNGPEQTDQ